MINKIVTLCPNVHITTDLSLYGSEEYDSETNLFIYLFTHIWSTTGCCMVNVVYSNTTVNTKGRETKNYKTT